GSLLLENWFVSQRAYTLDGFAVPVVAKSDFDVVNLKYALPLVSNKAVLSVAVNNLLDRQFVFQDTSLSGQPRVPLFYPHRTVMFQTSVRF
ncbi:MAG: hypothetical protein LWW92_14910, partial [Rhodocyclales bacterium]|nr:hypothetical protein [Rhodocyclales bacterium]